MKKASELARVRTCRGREGGGRGGDSQLLGGLDVGDHGKGHGDEDVLAAADELPDMRGPNKPRVVVKIGNVVEDEHDPGEGAGHAEDGEGEDGAAADPGGCQRAVGGHTRFEVRLRTCPQEVRMGIP